MIATTVRPTPVGLALLLDVHHGHVVRDITVDEFRVWLHTQAPANWQPRRDVTDAIRELLAAGWVHEPGGETGARLALTAEGYRVAPFLTHEPAAEDDEEPGRPVPVPPLPPVGAKPGTYWTWFGGAR